MNQPQAIKRFLKQLDIQLMVLPALAFIIVFSYIPIYGLLGITVVSSSATVSFALSPFTIFGRKPPLSRDSPRWRRKIL
ncbi:hypothetical protein GCM10008018_30930 [Paenibacillus marchantiophytorum]|uniref:Uncharacterized protein n=1 Tax=Paenibacillus marchantiophytorum TaxID=1619310 RepID=A0ABQ1EQP2_9BACL|nr:hypothetical protein GCM10008018_30930 [Paenibacillus marchantiophytorum]